MTKKHNHDTFETHIGSVSGPVHTGKGDIVIQHWDARGITAADLDALSCLFTDLRERVATEAPPDLANAAQAQLDALEHAATAEKPDVSAMQRVRDWFIKHLPSVAGSVTSLLVNPILGKVVEAAGDLAAAELRQRFAPPEPEP
ncbi:MAG TPA: hypothetical protein VMY40_04135 [Anaerolineae bacterium]|nr:hypothetical protein [Anaerolineae bacterium]